MTKKRIIVLIIAIFEFASLSFCQIDFNNYTTLLSSGDLPSDFSSLTYVKIKESGKNDNSRVSIKEKYFSESTKYVLDEILNSGRTVYGDLISSYAKKVAGKLLNGQSDILSQLRFYTVKSNLPKLFVTDEGIVLITTGLMAHLENEAELAFLMAREIAHFNEKHHLEPFEWQVYENSIDQQLAKLGNYQKDLEFKADEIGLAWYNNAGYGKQYVQTAMFKMMYTYLPFEQKLFPLDYFNTSEMYLPNALFSKMYYPITKEEDYNENKSLYPFIKSRKANLEKLIERELAWDTSAFYFEIEQFNEIQTISRFESLRTSVIDKEYGDALYDIFLLQRNFPESIYLDRLKGIVWLNLMVHKAAKLSSQIFDKPSEMQGNSATLHGLMKNLSKEAVYTLGLRQVYDLLKKYPNDKEIQMVYDKYIYDLATLTKFNPDNFFKMNYHAAKQIADSLIKNNSFDTNQEYLAMYDALRDSSKFYLFGISDIIQDNLFLQTFGDAKEKFEQEKENIALGKKLGKEANNVNSDAMSAGQIQKFIILKSKAVSKNGTKIDYAKSKKIDSYLDSGIEEAAWYADVKTFNFDIALAEERKSKLFNERTLLLNLREQLLKNEEAVLFPVDYTLIQKIKTDYQVSDLLLIKVEHAYQPNLSFKGVLSSILFYPVLFAYIPIGILTGHHSDMYVVEYNLETFKNTAVIDYYFKDQPKRMQLGAHFYSIFEELR